MKKKMKYLVWSLLFLLLMTPVIPARAATDMERLGVNKAWKYAKGNGVKVAIIDQGFDLDNSAIKGNIKGWYNANLDSEERETVNTKEKHGTNCAKNLVSVAPKVSLYAIKVYSDSDFVEGVIWAKEQGCRIISMSLTWNDDFYGELEFAVDYANENNMIVICAAGNKGAYRTLYPADYDNTVAVCAAKYDKASKKYKPVSKNTLSDSNDLSAPGSTTSAATPFVAGTAALLLEAKPGMSNTECVNLLKSTALDIGPKGKDAKSGYGLVQPYKALQKLLGFKDTAGKGKAYSVTLNANGGKVKKSSIKVSKGGAYGKLPTPTKKGYTFAGWYTKKSGGKKVTSGTIVTASKKHTLYAHWKAAKKLKVTLNANGGKVKKSSIKVSKNAAYGKLPTPTKKGYKFAGWYTKKSGGKKVTSGTKVTKSAGHTLYAHWK